EMDGARQQHPGLRPSKVRRADRAEAQHAVIEEAALVSHATDGPLKDRACEAHGAGIEVAKSTQRDHGLRDAVDIDRVRAVVVVPRGPVLPDEMVAVKLEPAA